jgi:signal transduction histidine kinase/DNA-binding response OmpR family regulator
MLRKITAIVDQHLVRYASLPGDTEETLEPKKAYLLALVAITTMFFFLTLLGLWTGLPVIVQFGIGLLLFFIPQIILFIRLRRGLQRFVFISNTFSILLTTWTIIRLGGITHSCGLIFAGLTMVVYSMIYPNAIMLWWSFILYVLSLIGIALLEPHLTPPPELTLEKNLLYFVLNAVWLSANILILVFYVYRKQADLASLKAQRLQEVDELKTRMFANIAHEFRTPLTLIGGMAELLHNDPQHQHRERTEAIQRNANKVLRLVDQMLNLARLEAGAMPLNPVQGDVTAFLRQVFQSFPGLAEYRKVRLHFLPEKQGFTMDFDPGKLEELVSNLLSNALKYTPAGGDVYFSFHAGEGQPERFIIKVKDTGIGIPPDKIAYRFDRFYRVEEGQKHYEEGSGIGLTLVREYVKLMGGEISVQSKPGAGAEFTVTLPVTRQAALQEAAYDGQLAPALANIPFPGFDLPTEDEMHPNEQSQRDSFPIPKGLPWREILRIGANNPQPPTNNEQRTTHNAHPHLLLIEDNPELSQYLRLVLGPKFHLLTASNGEEGIQQAIEHVPDLILSDVMMPVKDGFEVCRTLKKDFRTCHIPIVLLTARADTASRITGLEQGADAYLTKPFNQRELLVCLRNLFVQREKLRIKYSSPPAAGEPAATPGLDEIFLSNVRSHLEKNYRNDAFSIEDLYTALGISRVQLHRKLTALTGLSASQFIRSYRLEKARELLLTTMKTIGEIAFETGFADPNYFSRAFAQEYGAPPSELRKK